MMFLGFQAFLRTENFQAFAGRFQAFAGRAGVVFSANAGRADVAFCRGFRSKPGVARSGFADLSGPSRHHMIHGGDYSCQPAVIVSRVICCTVQPQS